MVVLVVIDGKASHYSHNSSHSSLRAPKPSAHLMYRAQVPSLFAGHTTTYLIDGNTNYCMHPAGAFRVRGHKRTSLNRHERFCMLSLATVVPCSWVYGRVSEHYA
eukprot:4195611-Amphidinium_carterae.1